MSIYSALYRTNKVNDIFLSEIQLKSKRYRYILAETWVVKDKCIGVLKPTFHFEHVFKCNRRAVNIIIRHLYVTEES